MTTAQMVIGAIAAYGAVAYIWIVIMGITDSRYDGLEALLVAAFWPFTLIILLMISLTEWLNDHSRTKDVISRTLDVLTLPLRPFTLGQRMSHLLNSRSKQQRGGSR